MLCTHTPRVDYFIDSRRRISPMSASRKRAGCGDVTGVVAHPTAPDVDLRVTALGVSSSTISPSSPEPSSVVSGGQSSGADFSGSVSSQSEPPPEG